MTKNLPSNDLAEIFKPNTGVSYEVLHPGTGKEIGLRLFLRSINDPAVKPITKRVENARLKAERTKRAGGFTAEEMEKNAIEIIAACVVGWEWYNDADGVPGSLGGEQLEFTPLNLNKILAIDKLRSQIDAELMDEDRFFTNSAKN